MKEPVDHILRPRLPWRSPDAPAITECGYNAAKVSAITREEFWAREKEMGRQRAALFTCMTCADTARRWGNWSDDPRTALQREIVWERGEHYWSRAREDRGQLLKDELLAIASLIEAHREEFEAYIAETEQRRAWRAKKAEMQSRTAGKPKDIL